MYGRSFATGRGGVAPVRVRSMTYRSLLPMEDVDADVQKASVC